MNNLLLESNLRHVVTIPSFFPSAMSSFNGTFIQEQMCHQSKLPIKQTLWIPETPSLKDFNFNNFHSNHFQVTTCDHKEYSEWRLNGWNLAPKCESIQIALWSKLCLSLANSYLKKHPPPDLIHAHSLFPAGYAAYQIWKRYKIPYVITEHRGRFLKDNPIAKKLRKPWYPSYFKKVLQSARAIMAVSQPLIPLLNEWAPTGRYFVIPNMIAASPKIQFKQQNPPPFTFFALAHLEKHKSFDILIKAMNEIQAYPVRLIIGGDGPEYSNLKSLIAYYKLQHKISFTGSIPREKLSEYMNAADAFLHPSSLESFGMVILEALAHGLPVVATDSGGPADLITTQNGILVECENVPMFAMAMLSLYQNRESYNRQAISETTIKKYNPDMILKELRRVYEASYN